MSETTYNIEALLNNNQLVEAPAVATFYDDLPRPTTIAKMNGAIVTVHTCDDSAVAVVDYPAGACLQDTALTGSVEDVHEAAVRLVRQHDNATAVKDEFDVLSVSSPTRAGEER